MSHTSTDHREARAIPATSLAYKLPGKALLQHDIPECNKARARATQFPKLVWAIGWNICMLHAYIPTYRPGFFDTFETSIMA